MKIFEVEAIIDPSRIDTEDGGCAKIATVEEGNDIEVGMFVRLQSWDDCGEHETFNQIVGKTVRVTVEILD